MKSTLKRRGPRTVAMLAVEIILAGVWALFDADFLKDNAVWFITAGLLGLAAVWFYEQINEFREYKKTTGTPRTQHTDWMPMHLALRYIALESEWSHQVELLPAPDLDSLLENEVKERLARGQISARGIETIKAGMTLETETTTPINPDFWETAFFQPFAEIQLCDDKRGAASRRGNHLHVPAKSYRQVVFNRDDIIREWPKSKLGKKLSRFYQPLIDDFTRCNEGSEPSIDELEMFTASHDEFRSN